MSKNLKKVLVTGASLLMLASAGAGFSNVSHASEASDFNKLTSMMNNDGHVENYRNGADQGYTVVHNGKRITVTMTHAYINGRKVSYSKALRAFRQKAHAKRSYKPLKRYRRVRRNHKAKRVHARKPTKKARKAIRKSRSKRSVRMTPAKAKKAYIHKISMKRLTPSELGYTFGLEVPAQKSPFNVLEYLPVKASSKFNNSYINGSYYNFKNILHHSSKRASADAHSSAIGFNVLNNFDHHYHANKDYIMAWLTGFNANKSYYQLPRRYNKYKYSNKFMDAFIAGYMAKNGSLTKSESKKTYLHFANLFD